MQDNVMLKVVIEQSLLTNVADEYRHCFLNGCYACRLDDPWHSCSKRDCTCTVLRLTRFIGGREQPAISRWLSSSWSPPIRTQSDRWQRPTAAHQVRKDYHKVLVFVLCDNVASWPFKTAGGNDTHNKTYTIRDGRMRRLLIFRLIPLTVTFTQAYIKSK